jgi:hypothetical protein
MTQIFLRRGGNRKEKLGALALSVGASVGVGVIVYYLARILMSRDTIELEPPVALETSEGGKRLHRRAGRRRPKLAEGPRGPAQRSDSQR